MAKEKSTGTPLLKPLERNDWPTYFESFTREHAGWLVSVDGEKATMPLERVIAREGGRIVIHLGNDLAHHRIITMDAANVRAAEGILQIDSTDGHRTHLALSAPRT
jgi:hypothetical protein